MIGRLAAAILVLSVGGCGDPSPPLNQQRAQEPPPPPTPAEPVPTSGRNILWLGHSLIRFAGSLDDSGNPTVIYSVPDVIEELRVAAERTHHPSAKPADWIRVIASNGWAADGYWATDGANHEFRTSTLAIIERPGLPGTNGRVGNSFEDVALLARWQPVPGGADARWNMFISISGASYFGPDSHERSFRQMSELYRFVREGIDPRVEGAEYRANPDVELIHYMGVPPHEQVRPQICSLARLYHRFDAAFPNSRTAPVAVAFRMAFDAYPRAARRNAAGFPGLERDVDRMFRRPDDSVHFSDRGIYLAALVFYAVLYGDPVGLPVPASLQITAAESELLQAIARDSFAEYGRYQSEPASVGCPPS